MRDLCYVWTQRRADDLCMGFPSRVRVTPRIVCCARGLLRQTFILLRDFLSVYDSILSLTFSALLEFTLFNCFLNFE